MANRFATRRDQDDPLLPRTRLLGGRRRSARRVPRPVDLARRGRLRAISGVALGVLGLFVIVTGVGVTFVPDPPPVRVTLDRPTTVPRAWFFQSAWTLYGSVDDPRRVPPLEELGCTVSPRTGLPRQPLDLTAYGSRVVEGQSLNAVAYLGRPRGATLDCSRAAEHQPLWVMPAQPGPQFAPTALVILGTSLLAAAALTHPGIGTTWLDRLGRRGGRRPATSSAARRSSSASG